METCQLQNHAFLLPLQFSHHHLASIANYVLYMDNIFNIHLFLNIDNINKFVSSIVNCK